MDTDLRIPLTSEQKLLIVEATRDEPEGMAAWARAILLGAARSRLVEQQADQARESPPDDEVSSLPARPEH
jgi:hypothetical protein